MASDVTLRGLDMADTQGDKAVVDYLRQMGARGRWLSEAIRVQPGELVGLRTRPERHAGRAADDGGAGVLRRRERRGWSTSRRRASRRRIASR